MAKAAKRSRRSSTRSSRTSRSSRATDSGKRSSSAKRRARATRTIAKKSAKKPMRAAGTARGKRKTAARSTREARAARGSRPTGGRVTKGVKYSKWIESPDDHEDRQGQSLATRNHDVIRQWADARGAVPATVEGTEHGGRPGVLRLNFPGYGGKNLKEVDWNEWFGTFDQRGLVFLYQEHKSDGATSNFFRLDNPEREDG